MELKPVFVRAIPENVRSGIIYISIEYATVVHKCVCGCEMEVATPLSSKGWTLTFDGEAVSLRPSIGNWSFSCRSHYWITRNKVKWAESWSQSRVDAARLSEYKKHRETIHGVPEYEVKNGKIERKSILKTLADWFKGNRSINRIFRVWPGRAILGFDWISERGRMAWAFYEWSRKASSVSAR